MTRPASLQPEIDATVADHTWRLPVPATFVLDPEGVVRARHVDPDSRTRSEPVAALDALRAL